MDYLAVIDFNKALEIDSSRPEIYYYRGNYYFNRGEYEKAAEDYDSSQ